MATGCCGPDGGALFRVPGHRPTGRLSRNTAMPTSTLATSAQLNSFEQKKLLEKLRVDLSFGGEAWELVKACTEELFASLGEEERWDLG